MRTKSIIKKLKGHNNIINCINFNNTSNLIVSGSYDNTIKIWDLGIYECLNTIEQHNKRV